MSRSFTFDEYKRSASHDNEKIQKRSVRETKNSPQRSCKSPCSEIPETTVMSVTAGTREQILQRQREAALRRRKQQFQSGYITNGCVQDHEERIFAPSVKNFSHSKDDRKEASFRPRSPKRIERRQSQGFAKTVSYEEESSYDDNDYKSTHSRRSNEFRKMSRPENNRLHSPHRDFNNRQKMSPNRRPPESISVSEDYHYEDNSVGIQSSKMTIPLRSNQSFDEQTYVSELSEQRLWDEGKTRDAKRGGVLVRSPTGLADMAGVSRQHQERTNFYAENKLSEADTYQTDDSTEEDGTNNAFDLKEEKPLVQVEEKEGFRFGDSVDWGNTKEIKKLLMEPIPKSAGMVKCYIKRNKGKSRFLPEYRIYLKDGDKFLMTTKKRKKKKTSNYLISMARNDHNKGSEKILGKLRSNFMGTEFQIYDDGKNPKNLDPFFDEKNNDPVRTELGSILYGNNIGSARGPRNMQVCINKIRPAGECMKQWQPAHKDESMIQCFKHKSESAMRHLLFFENRRPKWNEDMCAYVLNFNGRVTMASVKNFQLIDKNSEDGKQVILQFGRTGDDEFIMDVQWPISLYQAFAISLSSCDSKLACD